MRQRLSAWIRHKTRKKRKGGGFIFPPVSDYVCVYVWMCGGSVYRAGMSSGLATGEQNQRKVNSLQCFCKKQNKRKTKQAKLKLWVLVCLFSWWLLFLIFSLPWLKSWEPFSNSNNSKDRQRKINTLKRSGAGSLLCCCTGGTPTCSSRASKSLEICLLKALGNLSFFYDDPESVNGRLIYCWSCWHAYNTGKMRLLENYKCRLIIFIHNHNLCGCTNTLHTWKVAFFK